MCANVWHVSGVLMRWIWLVASTDAMDALGVLLCWPIFVLLSCQLTGTCGRGYLGNPWGYLEDDRIPVIYRWRQRCTNPTAL